jgi:glycine/D-amino acid oxidase-like deaminating enzyme
VFGVTAAIELERRGHRVCLLDPGPLPRDVAASTDISKAVRMDYGADDLYMAMGEEALDGWDFWNSAWDEPLYHEDGFLFLSRDPMEPGGFEYESYALLRKRGHEPERIDSRILAERHPAWNAKSYVDGYVNRRAGWAESRRVMEKLVEVARAAGVRIVEQARFARLVEKGSRVVGVATADDAVHEADFVILAAGSWTPTLLPHLSEVMWAVAQPVLHFAPHDPETYRPPAFLPWGADLARTGWYGFPATSTGTVKIAHHGRGRRVDPDTPRTVDASEEKRFREFLRDTFPGLAAAPLEGSRLCLYCDTWDGNFWIDHDPDREGLVVAAGGSGHGFKFAPVLGSVIADVVEGKPNVYAPRFAWRPRGTITTEDARFTDR